MNGDTYDSYEADGRIEWLRDSGYFGDCQEIAYAPGSTESEEDCERAEFDAASAEEWLQESGYYEDENPQGNPPGGGGGGVLPLVIGAGAAWLALRAVK